MWQTTLSPVCHEQIPAQIYQSYSWQDAKKWAPVAIAGYKSRELLGLTHRRMWTIHGEYVMKSNSDSTLTLLHNTAFALGHHQASPCTSHGMMSSPESTHCKTGKIYDSEKLRNSNSYVLGGMCDATKCSSAVICIVKGVARQYPK